MIEETSLFINGIFKNKSSYANTVALWLLHQARGVAFIRTRNDLSH
ncbi:MAG: hypothetical protein ABF956_07530 [Acetobacter sp.]